MGATSLLEGLTPAQRRFAERRRAIPWLRGERDDWVFFYHDEPWGTYRWLVDAEGRTLDVAALRKDA